MRERAITGVVIDAAHGRYCYSTQEIKTIRTIEITNEMIII